MKKLIFNMMLLPILGFSYELDFNKSFSKIVNPDLLSTNITISVEKKEENKVNSEIEKFNNFIKDSKSVTIKNGNYTLSPKYEYKDNKTEFKGYVGDLRYTAQSKDAKNINKFVNDLLALKEQIKSADIKLDISNISWEVSQSLQNKNSDELRLEAINWIEDYSNSLSSKLSKRCEVKNINIDDNGSNIVYARSSKMALSSSFEMSDVVPVSSEQNITINPRFLLECR